MGTTRWARHAARDDDGRGPDAVPGRRLRKPASRRAKALAAVLGGIALTALGLLAVTSMASAEDTDTFRVGTIHASDAGTAVPVQHRTYAVATGAFDAAHAAHDTGNIQVDFAAPTNFTMTGATYEVDPALHAIVVTGTSTDFMEVVAGEEVSVLVLVQWPDTVSTEPSIVISGKLDGFDLGTVFGVSGAGSTLGVDTMAFTAGVSEVTDVGIDAEATHHLAWNGNHPEAVDEFFADVYGADEVPDPIPALVGNDGTLDGTIYFSAGMAPDFLGDLVTDAFDVDSTSGNFVFEGSVGLSFGSNGTHPAFTSVQASALLPRINDGVPSWWPDVVEMSTSLRWRIGFSYDGSKFKFFISVDTASEAASVGDEACAAPGEPEIDPPTPPAHDAIPG